VNIFISIAAYRDPELEPTIRDCIARARWPGDLRFGVCWQHGEGEARPAILDDPRLRVIAVPWQASGGACWARAEIMKLWDHEDFFLQIDSHHRFVQDWDAMLLEDAARSGAARPVLSTYPAAYEPGAPLSATEEPTQIDLQSFAEDGLPVLHPRAMAPLGRPRRARFVAAGFLFTLGRFVRDVPYDPELYFIGEEIALAVRAFTHGYDLFHPSAHVLWHQYTRADCRKHWDDHVHSQGITHAWHARDAVSRAKVRRLLTQPECGRFGVGAMRGLAEYEAYAGLSFAHAAAQDATLQGAEPPNAPMPANWASQVRTWRMRIELPRGTLPPAALRNPRFWYVGFHDAGNEEIYRQDTDASEVDRLLAAGAGALVIERTFRSARRPEKWVVWPVSGDGAWLDRLEGVAA
jgi:plasmid stabilization system protein ParE